MKTCRVIAKCLLVSLVLVGMMVVSAGATPSVYLIGAGDLGQDNKVSAALTSQGFSVTIGATYDAFDGTTSLSPFNAVLLMPGFGGNGSDMPDLGQTALLNYVNGGGGLVTTEWTLFMAGTSRLTTLSPALPVTYHSYQWGSSTTYFQKVVNLIIDYNLPASSYTFNSLISRGGTESALSPKGGAQVFFDSSFGGTGDSGYAGVAGWTYGSGHVISLSMLAAQDDTNFQQLLANSVNWAGGTSVPVPPTAFLLGTGLLGLVGWRRLRKI